jgi:hypothetical protein
VSALDRHVRRLECRLAARAESLTTALQYVTPDGNVVETHYFRYDGSGSANWHQPGPPQTQPAAKPMAENC